MIKVDLWPGPGEHLDRDRLTGSVGKPITVTAAGTVLVGIVYGANVAPDGSAATITVEVEGVPGGGTVPVFPARGGPGAGTAATPATPASGYSPIGEAVPGPSATP
jgi:hypothetical protein